MIVSQYEITLTMTSDNSHCLNNSVGANTVIYNGNIQQDAEKSISLTTEIFT